VTINLVLLTFFSVPLRKTRKTKEKKRKEKKRKEIPFPLFQIACGELN